MQNPKAGGSGRVLDIRPENIDTYTETHTPEGGTEQTAEYKIVDAHPIIGGVLDKMAFFRTHASAVWYNKMKNITVLQKLDNLASNIGILAQLATTDKSSLVGALNELNGKMVSKRHAIEEIIDINSSAVEDVHGNVIICGNILNLYTRFKVISNTEQNFGVLKQKYRPKSAYAILPVFSNILPYGPANSSIWFHEQGGCRIYGVTNGGSYYTYGTWIF